MDLGFPGLGIKDVLRVAVESRQRRNRTDEHPHWMSVVVKAVDEFLDVLMDESVVCNSVLPLLELGRGRQFSVKDQVGHLEVIATLGELLNGIAAVAQNPLVAVDKSYSAPARRGIHECRIIGHEAKIISGCLDFSKVSRSYRSILYRHLILLASSVIHDRECALAHTFSLPAVWGLVDDALVTAVARSPHCPGDPVP